MTTLADLLKPGPVRAYTWEVDMNRPLRPLPWEETTLLDAAQVADLLGVSRRWVMARTRAGEIPALRFGKVFRYRKCAIEEWMEDCHAERLRLSR
jgi:excisionase family DNA binding protein